VRTAIRLGGTASERQREGVDERGQQDRTGRDRVTRAASRGEEPMASCTATTGAADQCDLLRKTLGRRSASKAEQVRVAASCSSPPEPFAGSPPSPALHRQVHVLRRSWRTCSPRALVCVCRLLFCTPLERVERTVDLAATRCAVLGARGGGLEPAAATAWMRCVPVHPREKSNRRSRSWRQPARA